MQLIYRFLAGGLIVSLFAVIGDVVRPKGFAGLFGAAPSVALATLTLAVLTEGKPYAALEARSMIAGSVAFFLYALACLYLMSKMRLKAAPTTLATGLISKHYGPVIGGLFLAFPAIFPASTTLLEKHERDKKRRAGIPITVRGRLAVALDARGTAMGAMALAVFAVVIWKLLPLHNAAVVFLAALGYGSPCRY